MELSFTDLDLDSIFAGKDLGQKKTKAKTKHQLSREELIAAAAEARRKKPSPWRAVAVVFVTRDQTCRACGNSVPVVESPEPLVRFEHINKGTTWDKADHFAAKKPGLPKIWVHLEPQGIDCCPDCFSENEATGDIEHDFQPE